MLSGIWRYAFVTAYSTDAHGFVHIVPTPTYFGP
jgi:hypothetical protein